MQLKSFSLQKSSLMQKSKSKEKIKNIRQLREQVLIQTTLEKAKKIIKVKKPREDDYKL